MAIRSTGDLRAYLLQEGLSPENLAERVPVSNMTWRRLLRRPDDDELPEKYRQLLEKHLLSPVSVVTSGFKQSEKQIADSLAMQGAEADSDIVTRDSEKRSETESGARGLRRDVSTLVAALRAGASAAHRPLILGALLYFLNPFDLVADAVVGLGFIDDLGVLSIAAARIRKAAK